MFHLPRMAQRQSDRKCGSSIAAFNFNLTLMLLDYFVADRESQPGADAYTLGSKAGIEDLRQILLEKFRRRYPRLQSLRNPPFYWS